MKLHKTVDGRTAAALDKFVILNSAVVFVGGAVKLSAGGIDGADAAGDTLLGICRGFVVDGGNTPIDNANSDQYSGTYSEGVSYTAASDNQTVDKVQALVQIVRPGDQLLAELDATKGTTTGSDTIGYYVSVLTSNESKLDESTATASKEQFLIVDADPAEGGDWVVVALIEGQLAQ